MATSSRRATRAARAVAPGLLVALPGALAVWRTSERASWATLGRDQGIFQYIAWAVSRGDVLYRDVRDVNGPLVALIHRALLALGGADEHRFRVLDLVFTAIAAAFAGGCLVALDDVAKRGRERVLRALSFGAAAWVVISAQYLAYGFWDTAQRESFFDWFLLVSIGLQIVGQFLLRTARPRRGLLLLGVAGAASVMPWFGKPTLVLFSMGQAAVLAFDDVATGRLRRLAALTAGGVLGALPPIAFLLARGDVAAWVRITFVDVPAMYRFIWPQTPAEIVSMPGHLVPLLVTTATAALVLVLVALEVMPRRALLLLIMPIAGLVSVFLQAKGFRYHFHPVTAGTTLALLAVVHAAWARAERSERRYALPLAGALALALGVRAFYAAGRETYPPLPGAHESLESEAWLAQFRRVDFFPKGLRDAAAHVAANTADTDTVQTYGMDPYVLFLARRRSATPYIYAYDLDVDVALAGGPTEAQARVIVAMRDAHEQDLLQRLQAAPPAAFIMLDRAPLLRFADAAVDFEEHCPDAFAWVRANYVESAAFDGIHVWLRVRWPP